LTAVSLHNTTGSLGYIGNNTNAFTIVNPSMGEDTDDDNATTATQIATAAMTGSTLDNTYDATGMPVSFPADVMAAIQQLLANQFVHDAAIHGTQGQQSTPAYTQQHTGTPGKEYPNPAAAVWRVSTANRGLPTGM
jgi:hypothetical protein